MIEDRITQRAMGLVARGGYGLVCAKNKDKKRLMNAINKFEVSGATNFYAGFNPVFDAIDKIMVVSGQYSDSL